MAPIELLHRPAACGREGFFRSSLAATYRCRLCTVLSPPPTAFRRPFAVFFSFCSSHAVCRVYVEYTGNGAEGCLTLVDLAGSEHKIDSMWCAAPPHTWTNNPTRWP